MIARSNLMVPRARRGARAAFAIAMLMSLGACATTAEPEAAAQAPIEKLGPEAVQLAERAIAVGRFADAKEILDRVLLGEPENEKAKLALGELALARGATGAAQQAFAALTSTPGVEARALQGEGISLLLMGEEVAGSNRLQRAVAADPMLWRAWNGLGSYHDGRGDWAAAVESYEKALAIEPNSLMVQNNLGYSYFMQGRLDDAINTLTRVLKRQPDFELARANLRLAYARKGKYVHALSGSSDRELGRNLNNVGYIALLRGDYDNAESYLLRAMEEEASFNRVAWKNLGYLKNLREIDAAEASTAAE